MQPDTFKLINVLEEQFRVASAIHPDAFKLINWL